MQPVSETVAGKEGQGVDPKKTQRIAPTTFQTTVYANSSYEQYEYAYRAIDPGRGEPVHFVIGDQVQVIGPMAR